MLLYGAMQLCQGKASDANPEYAALELQNAGADWLHVVDLDAENAGAPQNVESVHRVIGVVDIPVQFHGGLDLVHTAELMLGLGISRVVLDRGLTKTEHSAAHFFKKLGVACAAAVDSSATASRLKAAGCPRLIYTGSVGSVEEMTRLGIPIIAIADDARNLEALRSVGVEGAIVNASLLQVVK
ncbi:MAG: HisA/HisF-related TIM barrel protein [Fimbriimonadales bacterium]